MKNTESRLCEKSKILNNECFNNNKYNKIFRIIFNLLFISFNFSYFFLNRFKKTFCVNAKPADYGLNVKTDFLL